METQWHHTTAEMHRSLKRGDTLRSGTMPRFHNQWNHRNYPQNDGYWHESQHNKYDEQWDMSVDWSDEGAGPLNYDNRIYENSFNNGQYCNERQGYQESFHNGPPYEEFQEEPQYQKSHPKWTSYNSGHSKSQYFKGKPLIKHPIKYNKAYNPRSTEYRGRGREQHGRHYDTTDTWRSKVGVSNFKYKWVALDKVKGGSWKGYQSRKSADSSRREPFKYCEREGVREEERLIKKEERSKIKQEPVEDNAPQVACLKCACQKNTSEAATAPQQKGKDKVGPEDESKRLNSAPKTEKTGPHVTNSKTANQKTDTEDKKSPVKRATSDPATSPKRNLSRNKSGCDNEKVSSTKTLESERARMERVKSFTIPKKTVSNDAKEPADQEETPGRGKQTHKQSSLLTTSTKVLTDKIKKEIPHCVKETPKQGSETVLPTASKKPVTEETKKETWPTLKQTPKGSLQTLAPLACFRKMSSASQTDKNVGDTKRKIKDDLGPQEAKKMKLSRSKRSAAEPTTDVEGLFKPDTLTKSKAVPKKVSSEQKVSESSNDSSPSQTRYSISIPIEESEDSDGRSSGLKMLFTKSSKSETKSKSRSKASKTPTERNESSKSVKQSDVCSKSKSVSVKKENRPSQGLKTNPVIKKEEKESVSSQSKIRSESALETIGICLSNRVSIQIDSCKVTKKNVSSKSFNGSEIKTSTEKRSESQSSRDMTEQRKKTEHKSRDDHKRKVHKVTQQSETKRPRESQANISEPPGSPLVPPEKALQEIKPLSTNVQVILLNSLDGQVVYALKEEPGTASHPLDSNFNIVKGEILSPHELIERQLKCSQGHSNGEPPKTPQHTDPTSNTSQLPVTLLQKLTFNNHSANHLPEMECVRSTCNQRCCPPNGSYNQVVPEGYSLGLYHNKPDLQPPSQAPSKEGFEGCCNFLPPNPNVYPPPNPPLYYNLGMCYNPPCVPFHTPSHTQNHLQPFNMGSPSAHAPPSPMWCCERRPTNRPSDSHQMVKSEPIVVSSPKKCHVQTPATTPKSPAQPLNNSPLKTLAPEHSPKTPTNNPSDLTPDSTSFTCERCFTKLTSFFSLAIHMKTHEDFEPYQCDKCTEIFLQHSKFLSHVRSHSDAPDNSTLPSSLTDSNFEEEIEEECEPDSNAEADPLEPSPEKNSSSVSLEQIESSSENTVTSSTQSYSRPKEKVENTGKYPCDYCPEVFKSKKNLVKHLTLHKEKDLNICKQCDKIFSSAGGLKRHITNHKRKTLNICPFCFKGFISPTVLESHINLHNQEGVNYCVYCSKHFKKEQSLIRHMKVCPKSKYFECVDCRQTFVSASTFERHVKSHSEEMAYKCSSCQKSFCSDMELMDHFKTHAAQQVVFPPPLSLGVSLPDLESEDTREAYPVPSDTLPLDSQQPTADPFRIDSPLRGFLMDFSNPAPPSHKEASKRYFHPRNFTPVQIPSLLTEERLMPGSIKPGSVEQPPSLLTEFQDAFEIKIEVKEELFD